MPRLTGKQGHWELPHVHTWEERYGDLKVERLPIVGPDTKIFFVGACVSVGMAASLRRQKLKVTTHPDGHLYDPKTVRQGILAATGAWPERAAEPLWRTAKGWVDPFAKSYTEYLATEGDVLEKRRLRDEKAARMLRDADVVVLSAEFIETWRNPRTGNHFLQLPLPEVFESVGAEPHRLTVAEVRDTLADTIARVRRANPKARVVVSTSGISLSATVTPLDVRVASMASISRLSVAMAELCEADPSLAYFPAADIVRTADHPIAFMEGDGRHYHKEALDYFAAMFLRCFATDAVAVPRPEASFMRPEGAPEARPLPPPPPGLRELLRERLAPASLARRVRRWAGAAA